MVLKTSGGLIHLAGCKAIFYDTLHSLFRKMQSHEKEIARRAIELQKQGQAAMPLHFADPLKPFKDALRFCRHKDAIESGSSAAAALLHSEGNSFALIP